MTTTNSDVAAIQIDPSVKKLLNTPQTGGNDITLECVYTVLNTEVVNDLVRLFELPVGFRPHAPDVTVSTDGVGGTSVIVAIGTAANPDSLAAGLVLTTAATRRADNTGDEAVTPATSTVTEFLFLKFTTRTAAMTAGKKIVVRVPCSKT